MKDEMATALESLARSSALSLRDKLEWYANVNGLTFAVPLVDGVALREKVFARMLKDAIGRLDPADREYLESIPVVVSDAVIYQGHPNGRRMSPERTMNSERARIMERTR